MKFSAVFEFTTTTVLAVMLHAASASAEGGLGESGFDADQYRAFLEAAGDASAVAGAIDEASDIKAGLGVASRGSILSPVLSTVEVVDAVVGENPEVNVPLTMLRESSKTSAAIAGALVLAPLGPVGSGVGAVTGILIEDSLVGDAFEDLSELAKEDPEYAGHILSNAISGGRPDASYIPKPAAPDDPSWSEISAETPNNQEIQKLLESGESGFIGFQ